MSWLFSQALVEEYSGGTCSDGEPCAPLSSSPMQRAFLSHGKTTGFSRLSRFGMTCERLTDDHGAALLTSYLAASRARTSAPPALARVLPGGGRSGLWREMARIVGEVLPRFVFVENSPLLVGRGLAIVLGDLAALGYDAQWCCISASDCGAPHQRDRIWLVGHAIGDGWWTGRVHHDEHDGRFAGTADQYAGPMADSESERCGETREFRRDESAQRTASSRDEVSDTHGLGLERLGAESQSRQLQRSAGLHDRTIRFPAWSEDPADAPEPLVGRVAHGVAARVDRLKALGNGQVPRVAATAFAFLKTSQ